MQIELNKFDLYKNVRIEKIDFFFLNINIFKSIFIYLLNDKNLMIIIK